MSKLETTTVPAANNANSADAVQTLSLAASDLAAAAASIAQASAKIAQAVSAIAQGPDNSAAAPAPAPAAVSAPKSAEPAPAPLKGLAALKAASAEKKDTASAPLKGLAALKAASAAKKDASAEKKDAAPAPLKGLAALKAASAAKKDTAAESSAAPSPKPAAPKPAAPKSAASKPAPASKFSKPLNILVCVKQVPDTTEIKIDPETNTLIRKGVPSILNTFDGFALEAAARLKDNNPNVNIYVVCMGPDQAKAVLKESIGICADKAFLVSGRAFAGSDTLATSYILAQSARKIEQMEGIKFDMIFCGKQAIDGDTAQVGPEMAEHLDLPQVTYGLECKETDDENALLVEQEGEEGKNIIQITMPCLVTFTKPSFDPRFPTIKRKMAANKAEITVIGDSEEEFPDMDRSRIGLTGSPTKVKKTYTPERKKGGIRFAKESDDDTPAVLAGKLFTALKDSHVL